MNNQKWPLVANTQITEYLKKCLINQKVGGTYIFSGPDNLGKTTVAKFFAQIMLCHEPKKVDADLLPCGICASCKKFAQKENTDGTMQKDMSDIHGDFHIIKKDKDKKNISIEQVRDFIRMLNLSSFNNRYKVGIIKYAESLSREAANALLKTLEEPKKNTIIILIVKDRDSLPATIASRSQVLHFKPVKADAIYEYLVDDYKVQREKARDISRLCLGRPALAVKLLQNNEFYNFYNTKVNAFLELGSLDFISRFSMVENFFDKKASSQENVTLAHSILNIWQGIVRDYLLILLGHHNRVQHIYVHDKLKNLLKERGLPDFLKLSKDLSEAHKYLDANVNPRLVFENIALNI